MVESISRTTFIAGIALAIIASSLISAVISAQFIAVGPQGPKGDEGDVGSDGKSAYQIWLDEGNSGTEQDFLDSLRGVQGLAGIPGSFFMSKTASDVISTTETMQYIDMADMSISITINETSNTLILASIMAVASFDEIVKVSAMVGSSLADPPLVWLTPDVSSSDNESYLVGWGSYSFNFYKRSVQPGTYNIKLQWQVSGGSGSVGARSLSILVQPTT